MRLVITGVNGSTDTMIKEDYIDAQSDCPFEVYVENQDYLEVARRVRDDHFNNFFGVILKTFYYKRYHANYSL